MTAMCLLIESTMGGWFSKGQVSYYTLRNREDFKEYNDILKDWEQETQVEHSLGPRTTFHTDHGPNYFAFFRSLGKLKYFLAVARLESETLDDPTDEGGVERIAATGAAILRRLRDDQGVVLRQFWYLCDLKVHPMFRGRHLSRSMFLHMLPKFWSPGVGGYMVSMDPTSEYVSRIFTESVAAALLDIRVGPKLTLYQMSGRQMRRLHGPLSGLLGQVSYKSSAGIKDLMITKEASDKSRSMSPSAVREDSKTKSKSKSRCQRMRLWHVQHGPFADHGRGRGYMSRPNDTKKDAVYMIAAVQGSSVDWLMRGADIHSDVTCTIISSGMSWRGNDWEWVLTSDI